MLITGGDPFFLSDERIEYTTDAEEVAQQLEGLAEVLPDHFSFEEQPGGYFDHRRIVATA